jgi:hypothetical protein
LNKAAGDQEDGRHDGNDKTKNTEKPAIGVSGLAWGIHDHKAPETKDGDRDQADETEESHIRVIE